jgi:heme A synthase
MTMTDKLHRYALFTTALTFVLLLMGGIVHNTRSSLACPDWPLCYGQLMPKMEGEVLVEHSHRLVATTVGLLTIGLLVWLWRRGLRALGVIALLCVIIQGVLGGLTVIFRLPTLVSTAHLAVSQLFFCLLLYVVMRTRRDAATAAPLPERVRRWTLAATALVYSQMILGAFMRHLGAGLACLDVPLCRGSLWPADAVPALELHMMHRLFGVMVLLFVTASSVVAFRASAGRPGVRALALAGPILLVVQIGLGLLSITSFLGVVPVTAHLGVAALTLASQWVLHLVSRGPLGVPAERAVGPFAQPAVAQ